MHDHRHLFNYMVDVSLLQVTGVNKEICLEILLSLRVKKLENLLVPASINYKLK